METPPGSGYVNYPRMGRPRDVSASRTLSEAWAQLKSDMATWVIASIIFVVVVGIGYAVTIPLALAFPQDPAQSAFWTGIGVQQVVSIVLSAVYYTLLGGMAQMALKQVRGEPYSHSDMFSGFSRFLPILGVTFLTTLFVAFGAVACFLPGLIINGLLILSTPHVMFKNLGTWGAITASWSTLKPFLWAATWFAFFIPIASGIGILACGVGLLFTLPLYPISLAILYRDLVLTPEQTFAQASPDGTPPPGMPPSGSPPSERW